MIIFIEKKVAPMHYFSSYVDAQFMKLFHSDMSLLFFLFLSNSHAAFLIASISHTVYNLVVISCDKMRREKEKNFTAATDSSGVTPLMFTSLSFSPLFCAVAFLTSDKALKVIL